MNYEIVAVVETSLHEKFNCFEYVGDLNEDEFNEWKNGLSDYVVSGFHRHL